jgi:hypothetical protein
MAVKTGRGYGPHVLSWIDDAANPSFSDVLDLSGRDRRRWVVTCLIPDDNTGTITGQVSEDSAFTLPYSLVSLASDGTTSVITGEDNEAVSFAVRLPYFRLASSADEGANDAVRVVITGD